MKKIAMTAVKAGIGKTAVILLSLMMNLYPQQRSSVLLDNGILIMRTEGIAFLGSGMNETDAKTFALNDAKRNALEQAGAYIESHTALLNYQLVKDEVVVFSAGLVKAKVLHEERRLINELFAFKVDIEATIDTKLLDQRIQEIRSDSKLRNQLETERERVKRLEARIAELQSPGNDATRQEIKRVTAELTASDWYEKGIDAKSSNLKIYDYTKAIELSPRNVDAYYWRGAAYSDLGDYHMTIHDFTKVIEMNPENSMTLELAYLYRGMAYNELGRLDLGNQDLIKFRQMEHSPSTSSVQMPPSPQ